MNSSPATDSKTSSSTHTTPLTALSRWDMVSMLPIRTHNRVFINGFPGAGNVIVHKLCEDILRTSSRKHPVITQGQELSDTIQDRLLSELDFVGDRYNQFRRLLYGSLPQEWARSAYFQNRGMGKMDFCAFDRPTFLIVKGVDLGMHLNTNIHSSHELPAIENYRTYDALGYSVVPLVRHPLDILVSYASKGALNEDADRAFAVFLDTLETQELRRNALRAHSRGVCSWRMNSERWVAIVTNALREYYAPIATMAKDHPPIMYENILGNPGKVVLDLACRMGLEVSDEAVREISAVVGKVELAPNHLNQPSSGKWRAVVPRARYDIFRASGILDLFPSLGYEVPCVEEFADIDYGVASEAFRILPHEVLNPVGCPYMNSYFGLFNTFDPVTLAEQFGIAGVRSVQHGCFTVTSNDYELLEIFSTNLTDAILSELA